MTSVGPIFEEDTLFLACTRPAMVAGVTMEAMGINVMATTIFYLLAGSISYALVGIVFHFVFELSSNTTITCFALCSHGWIRVVDLAIADIGVGQRYLRFA